MNSYADYLINKLQILSDELLAVEKERDDLRTALLDTKVKLVEIHTDLNNQIPEKLTGVRDEFTFTRGMRRGIEIAYTWLRDYTKEALP